jgi:hypothetical protein
MDSISDMPAPAELLRVVVPDSPEFILENGERRHRGYVPSLEVWNTMTRLHVAFPAKGIEGESQRFRLVDDQGEEYHITSGSGSSINGLMSLHSMSFPPLRMPISEVRVEVALIPSGSVINTMSDLEPLWKTLSTVSL